MPLAFLAPLQLVDALEASAMHAVYALAKGYSGAADSARVVNLYHSCVARLGVTPWLEYVDTDDNIADLPSRGDYELLQLLSGSSSSFRAAVVPPLTSFTGPLAWAAGRPLTLQVLDAALVCGQKAFGALVRPLCAGLPCEVGVACAGRRCGLLYSQRTRLMWITL